MAGVIVLLAFFGPPFSAFAAIFIGLLAYVVIEVIYGQLEEASRSRDVAFTRPGTALDVPL